MAKEKIVIGIDNETIELKGEELKAFESMREQMNESQGRIEAEQQAKEAARQSAMNKLSSLGLTDEEISALIQ